MTSEQSAEPAKSTFRSVIEDIGKIKFNRTPTVVAQDPEYVAQLPKIAELYRNVENWHGTGRYKFSDVGELQDILDGIIKDGGLKPHEDDWDKKRGVVQTVSVAPSRMYARLYAGMFCPASTRISNELGSRELWGYYFLGTSGIVGMFEHLPNIRQIKKGDDSSSIIPGLKDKTAKWTGKVTAQEYGLKQAFLHGTDIAENYPILIGIKKGIVEPTRGSKFVDLHERRSDQLVPFSGISHVEVPRDKVNETKSVLNAAGHGDIEVLPIEFGEEYVRRFTFRQLVSGRPLAT